VIGRPGNEERLDDLVDLFVNRQKERLAVEVEIAAALGVRDPALVIVYCPRKSMQLKEAAIPVRRVAGIRPLTAYTAEFPALGQLVESYRNLWKLMFRPRGLGRASAPGGKQVERILGRRFPGIRNQYRP
jgi:hypothetical protein